MLFRQFTLLQTEVLDMVDVLGTKYQRTMIDYCNNKRGVKYESIKSGKGLFISYSEESFYCSFTDKGVVCYCTKNMQIAFEYALRRCLINEYLEALSDLKISMDLPLQYAY